MTTRDEVLEAVRRSTGGDQDAPVSTTSTAPAEPSATEVGRMDDQRPLADVFEDRAGEVGMHVHRVADMSAASDEVANILDSESIDRVLAWADRDVDGLEFRDGVEVERWDPSLPADDLKDSAFGMSCGVTGADYAVEPDSALKCVCASREWKSQLAVGMDRKPPSVEPPAAVEQSAGETAVCVLAQEGGAHRRVGPYAPQRDALGSK